MKIVSFSYKDIPPDVHGHMRQFDCRGLDNPYLHPELRARTGLDKRVQDFVILNSPRAQKIIELALGEYATQGRDLAFGCIGGKHRSVAVAEVVAGMLRAAGAEIELAHLALTQPAHREHA